MAIRMLAAGGSMAGAAFLGGNLFGVWGAVLFSVAGFLIGFWISKKSL